MKSLIKNKYRIESTRMQNWNYGWNAPYFITICTDGKQHFFGKIVNGKMILSEIGEIVKDQWITTPEIRLDMNLQLGEWIIIPNHFHAVIIIGKNKFNKGVLPITITSQNKFSPQSKNLGSIVRGFNSSVTKQARQINPNFGWMGHYYII